MKKLSIFILVTLLSTCISSFAQEYDYDEPVYYDESSSNDYPEEEPQYYEESYEEPRVTYCWVNEHWNKFCNYSNGCYHYWNQNWSQYHHCPGDELRAEQDSMLKERLNQMTRETSCGTNYPWTVLDETSWNCVCPDQKNGWPGWDPVNRNCPYIDSMPSSVNQQYIPVTTWGSDPILWYFNVLVIIIAAIAILRIKLNSKVKSEENEEVSFEPEELYDNTDEWDYWEQDMEKDLDTEDKKNIHGYYNQKVYTEEPRDEFTYDDYLEELENENQSDDWIEREVPINDIEEPYEGHNSAINYLDGHIEDDRGPDILDNEAESEYDLINWKTSSLDVQNETEDSFWATSDGALGERADEENLAHYQIRKEYQGELQDYRPLYKNFSIGETIEHNKFWLGTILSIRKDIAEIKFTNWGIKTIDLRIARIWKSKPI